MSSIDKLQILGVRSFDNKKAEIIKFFNPLTLIVGLNGSGKTTIIECLRYATTGELPPNSGQGGAWIHDPKLCGENEVLAQVKVSFNSTSGVRMVLDRKIQLTVKKTTRSQKALDATLMMVKNGERTTISSRVAELDNVMPQYLGVSKAILESVIFCHQDDSLWPMSTPAVLKKKFDEIFEALKYTKAVENIKLIRKNQMAELEKSKIHEQNAKIDKDRGARAELKSRQITDEMEELREQSDSLSEQVKEAAQKSNEAWNRFSQFEKIVIELRGKRIEAQAASKTISSLGQHMKEMADSDEELRSMLDQYKERLTIHEKDKDAHMVTYREQVQALQDSREALGKKQSEFGNYQAQKAQYDRQVEGRKQLVKDTARTHKIRGYDIDVTNDQVRDFMERMVKLVRDQQNVFDSARKATQDEAQRTQQELTALNNHKSALAQTKNSANSYVQVNDGKITRFLKEIDKIEVDEGGKAVMESNIKDLDTKLATMKENLKINDFDSKIASTDNSLRSLEIEKEKLDTELIEASRNAKDSARLDLLQKDLHDRQRGLETVSGAHGPRISTILEREWDPSTLEQVYQSVLSDKNKAIKEAELQRDSTSRELEQVKYKLATASDNLKQKRQEFSEHEKKVRDSIDEELEPSDYLEEVERLEANLDQSKWDQTGFQQMEKYYTQCIETLTERGMCRLCRRTFKTESEKKGFLKTLETFLTKAVEAAKDEHQQETEDALIRAKEARSNYDAWIRLQSELPDLDTETANHERRLGVLNDQLERHDQIISEREDAKRDVESVFKTVQSISKYHTDIGNIEAQITQLTAMQKTAQSSRGLEKIQEDQRVVSNQIRTASASLQQLRSDRDRAKSSINALELQVRDVRSQLSTAVHQLKEKTNLQTQIEDLKAHTNEQRNAVRRVDQEIQELAPQISQLQIKLEDIRARGDQRDRELQEELNRLMDSLNKLRNAEREIGAYIDSGGPQNLSRTTREITNLQDEIDHISDEQRLLTVEIKKIEQTLANHGETRRAINDNLEYRANVRHLQELEQEITQLESHNAEDDKQRYEREAQKWQHQRERLSAEQATIVGTLKSKDDQLAQLLQEWETDYKGAADNYRKAHIQVVITKAAIEDLARYGGALDKAIMKYHSLKMEEINRIIDELWRSTYQGTDVDSIMIRSENETQKGNKSYNYRVVMIKQDAEMDMRGRCSAGQKVLASIIIRLALAECFGVRCGMIALDEPTTNLDTENIRALAQALSEIIRVRRQQSNFQLIVITHDEEFLRYMNCQDYTDYYYRVSRDHNQCSQIFKQSIQAVV